MKLFKLKRTLKNILWVVLPIYLLMRCSYSTTVTYLFKFDSNGGSEVPSVEVNWGELLPKPMDPIKANFVFSGWYEDSRLMALFNFNTKIMEDNLSNNDFTLYAKWIDAVIKVTYDLSKKAVTGLKSSESSTTDLVIPASIEGVAIDSIGKHAFNVSPFRPSYSRNLQNVSIEDGIRAIGVSAFSNASKITSISLPNSVEEIRAFAFSNLELLQSITIPSRVKIISKNTFYNTGLTTITIPNLVTEISDAAFTNCTNLTEVNLSSSLKKIGEETFFFCINLTAITVPNVVTEIEYRAFFDCNKLTITMLSTIPPTLGREVFLGVFRGESGVKKIIVPAGSVTAYKTASEWSNYASIITD